MTFTAVGQWAAGNSQIGSDQRQWWLYNRQMLEVPLNFIVFPPIWGGMSHNSLAYII